MLIRGHGCLRVATALCLVALLLFSLTCQHATFRPLSKSSKYLGEIANRTLGFQNILVVNLPSRTDRKDAMSLTASISDLQLDWIHGVTGDSIKESAYPPGDHSTIPPGNKGSWRAHMNALHTIVEQNLTTALILEDDADWDFRLRSQLHDFALAARNIPSLLSQSPSHLGRTQGSTNIRISAIEAASRSSVPLSSFSALDTPRRDPYGSEWDIIWLGHCGAHLPPPSSSKPDRITILNDVTVPEPRHLKSGPLAKVDEIADAYPPHTRVIHRSKQTVCSIAYAVTQSGARKLLHEFGVREFSQGYDFALSDFCDGLKGGRASGRPLCITVQPPIFSHHFPLKANSDITGHGAGYVAVVETRYVRWSARMNLERVLKGEKVEDQWPDTSK